MTDPNEMLKPRNLKKEPYFDTTSNPVINTVNEVNYDKRTFVPFADERDHLGRIIDHVRSNYLLLLYRAIKATCSYLLRSLMSRSCWSFGHKRTETLS